MSRTYHISDFAAFLRKYGDSARDHGGWEESTRHNNRSSRSDRGANQDPGSCKMGMTGREQSIAATAASIPYGNLKSKLSPTLASSA